MSQRKITADRAGGLLGIILGIAALIEAVRLYPYRSSPMVGDHTMPALLGVILVVLGALLLFTKRNGPEDVPFPAKPRLSVILGSIALMFAYRYLIPLLGYALSTLLVSFGLFKQIGPYRWHVSLVFAIVLTASIYLIFAVWLKIPFPVGLFKL
ncbi:tripartite tricarboxylate transporter TctB family protein [Lihuaxuella thermophila]|uniref:Tripartite tricarboxylate transporter TctB family protein n=1 Tax=Lihuaxuella thermophila TaxID=1173111 RepID=A0A1H8H662_9BACL|nr:tripartite tricarboxylate transporter TctB family protein [Lihuaxuella thermophila]SEN50968.1 Tripartite tricarboxylate transporter TctB family protein [Lihuaxuella thermophila]